MEIGTMTRICCLAALLAGLIGGGSAWAADDLKTLEAGTELKEMPVLTGEQWQRLQPETKLAFIWGVGHVVTIEEHVMARHPELQRKGFVSKLAEGLKGIPMKTIVQELDGYYRSNPDDLDLPVMRVIWAQLVKPKLTSGVADSPIDREIDK